MNSIEDLDEEAKIAAEKMVMSMMQRPGQLEKVEQYKKRITHKKASIEAQLKSAVQGKLDGVSVGLKQLNECLDDIQQIEIKMDELQEALSGVPPLVASLQAVREEDMRHSQYVTAMDSLKHIFTVPETVAKTKQWIGEGKLLHAHQCLTDLENSRDDLLYELHRLPNQSSHDKIMLKAYFEDVEKVSETLEKQIKLILARTLNTVRKEPTVIVTALRIIEREEKKDQLALQQQEQTGFIPPGRPKKWRSKAFEVLEHCVAQRIEGTRVDEREDNKQQWLIRNLELTRQLVLEDLRVVTTLCEPCFPPHYRIREAYVNMYQKCLSENLQEVVASGLEGNEYVTFLSWVLKTYPGVDLMGHPDLKIEVTKLPPLLPKQTMESIEQQYLQKMESNYISWMEKTLESERGEWSSGRGPDTEPHTNAYWTHAPLIIYDMINQNLQVTETISKEIKFKALVLSVEQVKRFGQMYREGVLQFKSSHFVDRSKCPYFTQHMITIVNNAEQFCSLGAATQARHWPPGRLDTAAERTFTHMLDTFQKLREEASRFLLEEAFLDLEVHFDELFTAKWLQTSIPVDTICVTLEDYFHDYNHLREKNFEYVINEAHNLVYKKYVTALLSKKTVFKSMEECQQAATKIGKEANQIRSFFKRIAPEGVDVDRPVEIITLLAEVIRCTDLEMLSLDLHSVCSAAPDVTSDHLSRLMSLRPDYRQIPRDLPALALSAAPVSTQRPPFFANVTPTDRLLPFAL